MDKKIIDLVKNEFGEITDSWSSHPPYGTIDYITFNDNQCCVSECSMKKGFHSYILTSDGDTEMEYMGLSLNELLGAIKEYANRIKKERA